MKSLWAALENLFQRVIVVLTVIITLMASVWGFDTYMGKFATAKDVDSNNRAIGGLITLHKIIAEENKDKYIRERLDKLNNKISRLENKYLSKKMPPSVKASLRRLTQERLRLEKKLD